MEELARTTRIRGVCRQKREDDIFGGQVDSKLTHNNMVRRKHSKAIISHDPRDAPIFTHRVFTVYWSYLNCDILAIQDDDRAHYPFLKQWVGMEVDIDNRWSINNGTLGLDMELHNGGKHTMHYCVRLKIPQVELILKTKNNVIGIINEQKRLVYVFQPFRIRDLEGFLHVKKKTDAMVKEKHLSPKGWSIE